MAKRFIYLIITLFFIGHTNATLKENMEFYKKTANSEYVTLNNDHVRIRINPDYSVSMSGDWEVSSSNPKEKYNVRGNGHMSLNGDKIEIKLSGNVSGSYYKTEDVYKTETEYNVGSTTVNALHFMFDVVTLGAFSSDYESSTKSREVYDYTKRWDASGNSSFNLTLYVNVANNRLYLNETPSLSITLNGKYKNKYGSDSFYKNYSVSLGREYTISYGNKIKEEISIDQYGDWDWKEIDNATLLQLKSTNKLDDYHAIMQITIPKDKRSIKLSYLFLSASHIKSPKVQMIKEGYMLNEFTITCNDGTTLPLPFVMQEKSIKNNAGTRNLYNSTCVYATYDRFDDKYKSNAYSIISQLRSKEILFFDVLVNNKPFTFTFEQEGLDVLLNKLNI